MLLLDLVLVLELIVSLVVLNVPSLYLMLSVHVRSSLDLIPTNNSVHDHFTRQTLF